MKKTFINLLFATVVSVISLTTAHASFNESLTLQKKMPQTLSAEATSALFELCKAGGELNQIQELIDRGADVHATINHGNTPLHVAAENGHINLCLELVKKEQK